MNRKKHRKIGRCVGNCSYTQNKWNFQDWQIYKRQHAQSLLKMFHQHAIRNRKRLDYTSLLQTRNEHNFSAIRKELDNWKTIAHNEKILVTF